MSILITVQKKWRKQYFLHDYHDSYVRFKISPSFFNRLQVMPSTHNDGENV